MNDSRKRPKLISCIIPVYNEEALIESFIHALKTTLAKTGYAYELVIVDDGSQDHTAEIIHHLKGHGFIHYLRFSRNFGKEQAISAGLDHAQGDVVILIDSDFQHPLELIPTFLQYWEQGYEMVYATRTNRQNESIIKRYCAQLFYQLNGNKIPPHAGDFRLLDRKVVQALRQLPERSRFMKGLYGWVGFRHIAIPFEAPVRHIGHSRWNYASLFELALTGITSSSILPLRLIAVGGLCMTVLTLFCGIILYGFSKATSTTAIVIWFISLLGGLNFFALGIIGEYIGRILIESKQRPVYLIDHEASFKE
ncbi:MAG: glycosyltransferase [Legionella sp.]|nr:MAG: glycosyltransferase [Legionella sp.]PJD98376.1 MAG: glycosyltransferase [Legionella sp.]